MATSEDDLGEHTKTHNKNYYCPDVDCKHSHISFKTKKILQRHIREQHSRAPPRFYCQYPSCEYFGVRAENRRDHQIKRHGQLFPVSINDNADPTVNPYAVEQQGTTSSHILDGQSRKGTDSKDSRTTPASSVTESLAWRGSRCPIAPIGTLNYMHNPPHDLLERTVYTPSASLCTYDQQRAIAPSDYRVLVAESLTKDLQPLEHARHGFQTPIYPNDLHETEAGTAAATSTLSSSEILHHTDNHFDRVLQATYVRLCFGDVDHIIMDLHGCYTMAALVEEIKSHLIEELEGGNNSVR
jgi:hypothetical protein